jgi:hypothetical protein
MDADYDNTNTALSQTLSWVATSLNTDGSLKAGSVGQSQMVSGLFDDIAQGIIDEVQPLVDQAQSFASAAAGSSTTAQAAATAADVSNTAAQGAASVASGAQTAAVQASSAAQGYASTAQTAASDAKNAANDAAGDLALAEDYGVLTQAWAEHMPDPIPPNILAVMGITGDHWSSRWWATKAENAFGYLTSLYLGVHPVPPTTTATGDPIPLGGIYYNSTTHQVYVWDGTQWQTFWAPTKAYTLSLSYLLTAGQTQIHLNTADLGGQSFTLSATEPEPLDVYLNGVRLAPATNPSPDWTVNFATSTVTLAKGALANTLAVIDILTPTDQLAPSRVITKQLLDFDIDPATGNPGQIDGTRKTFSLALASDHSTVSVLSPVELQVILDGATQKPGADFSTSGSQITFTEAPIPGEAAWSIWFGSST